MSVIKSWPKSDRNGGVPGNFSGHFFSMNTDSDLTIDQVMAAIRLSRLPGVGASRFKELRRRFKDPISALSFQCESLHGKQRILPGFSLNKSKTEIGISAAREFLNSGGKAAVLWSNNYPPQLFELSEPPPILFYCGEIAEKPMIAVVGTRQPSKVAREMTSAISKVLVLRDYGIISGGAKGIDTVSHVSCLEAGGFTIAVFGTGIDVFYPKENSRLFREISAKGAIVSELLPGTKPKRDFFPTRNRIVAGWGETTVIIQAGFKSGSLITANFAVKFGKPCLVFSPSDISGDEWAGNRDLISRGFASFSNSDELMALLKIRQSS